MLQTMIRAILLCHLLSSILEVDSLMGYPSVLSRTTAPQMVATYPRNTVSQPQITQIAVPVEETKNEALPWSCSINPARTLSYMPMFQIQLDLMKELGFEQVELKESFVYRESSVKPARIGNALFKSDKFRKIRLTYFDAGDNVQVFNSLWYPSFEYDLPMLGIDLISLGKSRVLSVIDFQPLHPTVEYSEKYISHLSEIRNKYPDLQGSLSGKIYDDVSWFSKEMLFGRFTNEDKITSVVLPAFNDYLNEYLKLMDNAVPDHTLENINVVENRQKEYDIYSAVKDPAVGLFDAYFGKEWSNTFVHDFLFSYSKAPEDTEISPHVHNFKISNDGEVKIKSN